ncbi:type II toxin-antitoxin system ParD family antitoxin [Rhizobium wenxiniae]|uniref:type II toxin-antitoxin system ParD family antitoxin n=1 Tax=Rhizobium wenxiniae TaxID=1737357 RepID=UPI003C1E876B
MGEIISIKVDDALAAFIRGLVASGRYVSESDVVEEALQLLKESEESAIEALRAAIEEGEASGEPRPFDFDKFLAEMHRKHGR